MPVKAYASGTFPGPAGTGPPCRGRVCRLRVPLALSRSDRGRVHESRVQASEGGCIRRLSVVTRQARSSGRSGPLDSGVPWGRLTRSARASHAHRHAQLEGRPTSGPWTSRAVPDSDRAYERLESYLEYRGFRPAPFRARPATELVIWPLCLHPGCRHPATIVPFGAGSRPEPSEWGMTSDSAVRSVGWQSPYPDLPPRKGCQGEVRRCGTRVRSGDCPSVTLPQGRTLPRCPRVRDPRTPPRARERS